MPRPDWFVDATFHEYIYLLESRDDEIKRTYHFSKESPDGPFHYFATDPEQGPFRLSAPMMAEEIHALNNWYDYREYDDLDDKYFEYINDLCIENKTITKKYLMDSEDNQKLASEALGFMYYAGLYFKGN